MKNKKDKKIDQLVEKAKAGETEPLESDGKESEKTKYMTVGEFKAGINPIWDIFKSPINKYLESKGAEGIKGEEFQEMLNRIYDVIRPALKYTIVGNAVGNAFSRGNLLYKIVALATTIGSIAYPRYKQVKKQKELTGE